MTSIILAIAITALAIVVGINTFVVITIQKSQQPTPAAQPSPREPEPVVNTEEMAKVKRKLAAEQEAFLTLMSYNADAAYGRKGGRE